jgi:Cytochrome c7 and related cytochrome c
MLGAACTARLWTRFPHQQHLATADCGGPGKPQCLACTSCHLGAEDAAAWKKPGEDKCHSCHKMAEPKFHQALATRSPASPLPAGLRINFNHTAHLAMPDIKGQCIKCHQGAVQPTDQSPIFPPMATCLGCHEHAQEFAQNTCTRCHQIADLRASKPVSFLPHTEGWMRRHASFARDAAQTCTTCHAQTQCDACHDATQSLRVELRAPEAVDSQQVHRFDFLSRHATESRSQPAMCVSCHQKQDCDACHARRGISGASADPRNPHPANWAVGGFSTSNEHGRAARRDIASCAACHDQGAASNCVRCHKVGAFGGSPHPPGWRSSQPTTAESCAICHRGAP